MSNRTNRTRDINQLAKLITDVAIGEATFPENPPDNKNPAAVALGRLGGLRGGKARAEKLSPQQRSEIAKNAAQKRWQKPKES